MQDAQRQGVFKSGDQVYIVCPAAQTYMNRVGVICGIGLSGNSHRYYIEFEDGTTGTFFDFDLSAAPPPVEFADSRLEQSSAKCAAEHPVGPRNQRDSTLK